MFIDSPLRGNYTIRSDVDIVMARQHITARLRICGHSLDTRSDLR